MELMKVALDNYQLAQLQNSKEALETISYLL